MTFDPVTPISAFTAYMFFNFSKSFDKCTSIAEKLNTSPNRKTAYKIGIFFIQTGFFWMGINSLAVSGGSIYSMATGQFVFANSSLFMRTLVVSSALSFGMIAISFPFTLYARAWQVF